MLLLKAVISVGLLYLALHSIDLSTLGARLTRLHVGWIALSLAAVAAQVVLSAIRWQIIAQGCGLTPRFGQMQRMNFIATFFNQVLPSTVGGDAVRLFMLARESKDWQGATYSVLLDRIVGTLSLTLLVFLCLPRTLMLVDDRIVRLALILAGCSTIVGAIFFLAIGRLSSHALTKIKVIRHLVQVSRVAWGLCASPRHIVSIMSTSLSVHVLAVFAAWCVAQASASAVDFQQLLFVLPPVNLIAMIPVSIAGWGLREGGMIVGFYYAGLSQDDALIVSILTGLTIFAVGVVGGIVWVVTNTEARSLIRGERQTINHA